MDLIFRFYFVKCSSLGLISGMGYLRNPTKIPNFAALKKFANVLYGIRQKYLIKTILDHEVR